MREPKTHLICWCPSRLKEKFFQVVEAENQSMSGTIVKLIQGYVNENENDEVAPAKEFSRDDR